VLLLNLNSNRFDIEACDNDPSCWDDAATNIQFIQTAVRKAQNMGVAVGIYSTPYEWFVLNVEPMLNIMIQANRVWSWVHWFQ
jgi:ABC-type proline/glycine betaine transport system permease subunit